MQEVSKPPKNMKCFLSVFTASFIWQFQDFTIIGVETAKGDPIIPVSTFGKQSLNGEQTTG